MHRRWLVLAPLVACVSFARFAFAGDDTLEEIVVTASLRSTPVADLPQSVTVLMGDTLQAAGVQHFEDVLSLIPDLNYASGTSRPRFFQLRGIGEVEQYQGAPNPSVGFLIDDIDFSGVGMPATLFDTQQVEVLRGPQGTTYGANALAGLISVRTADPGKEFELNSEITGATYDTRSAGLAVGDGFASGTAGWRFVAQQFLSDGFRHNAYLDENSTNGFDEGTLRGKVHWQVSDALQADLTLMHVNINNGYDAWSIYNTYTTYSNQPGRDGQLSNGAALRLALFGRLRWVAGVYALRLTESDNQVFTWDAYDASPGGTPGAGSSGLNSQYGATNVALYGSLEADVGARTTVSGGLRLEQRLADYSDSADVLTPFPEETNHMVGGNLSWERKTGDGENVYVTLARGYKGGGFNIGSGILSEQRQFYPESLWSIETGVKFARSDNPLQLQADVFYMRRQNMQVYLSEQLQQNNPLDYVFFTQNASNGENYGLEGEASYRLGSRWQISGSASLLRTRYLNVTGIFSSLDLDGREQPFAPGYKLSAAVAYHHPAGWFARLDASAMDSFYYYTSDAQTSSAYNLENLRVGYRHGSWAASLWVHNVFDARYAQNGFYFGLIPPNFPNQSFLDLGDPRQIGITFNYELRRNAR